jgi:hypothetical protein
MTISKESKNASLLYANSFLAHQALVGHRGSAIGGECTLQALRPKENGMTETLHWAIEADLIVTFNRDNCLKISCARDKSCHS